MEEDFGFGGPGPEDRANAAAALSSALRREAATLAQAAGSLRACLPGPTDGGPISDIRRARSVAEAASEAALLASLLLEAASAIAELPADLPARLHKAAQRVGLGPALLVPPIRAAALALPTDDGSARIAAALIADELGNALSPQG
jgi:hypothetical protein